MATRTHASPKADFILGLPSTLPVSEVVARAAAAGMSLSGSMVRKTRAAGSPQRRAKPAATKQRAADRSETPRPAVRARPGSKRAFVLSFADDTPAGEIVTAAEAKGFQLPTGYVYWVRSDAARKARRDQASQGAGAGETGQSSTGSTKRAAGAGPTTRRPTRGATGRPGRSGTVAEPRAQALSSATSSTTHREAEGLLIQTAIRVVGIERAMGAALS